MKSEEGDCIALLATGGTEFPTVLDARKERFPRSLLAEATFASVSRRHWWS